MSAEPSAGDRGNASVEHAIAMLPRSGLYYTFAAISLVGGLLLTGMASEPAPSALAVFLLALAAVLIGVGLHNSRMAAHEHLLRLMAQHPEP